VNEGMNDNTALSAVHLLEWRKFRTKLNCCVCGNWKRSMWLCDHQPVASWK